MSSAGEDGLGELYNNYSLYLYGVVYPNIIYAQRRFKYNIDNIYYFNKIHKSIQ